MGEKMPYDREFQKSLLSIIVKLPEFMTTHRGLMKPSYFEYENYGILLRIIAGFHDKESRPPQKDELGVLIVDYCKKHGFNGAKGELVEIGYNLYESELGDYTLIVEKAVRWATMQAIKQAITKSVHIVETDGDYEEIRRLMEEALSADVAMTNGLEVFRDYRRLNKLLQDSIYGRKAIKTLIPDIDDRLFGGLLVGEVGTFYGAPGMGKSLALVNLAWAASRSKEDVVYFTIGDLEEIDILLRMCSRFSGIDMKVINANFSHFLEAFQKTTNIELSTDEIDSEDSDNNLADRRRERAGYGRIHVKYYNPKTINAHHLRSYIASLESRGLFKPGLLVIDYADEMLPTQKQDNSYDAMGWVYSDLKTLGREVACPVWTASQITRGAHNTALEGGIVDIASAADSWQKSMKADVVIGLMQTHKEKTMEKRCRLFIAKARRGEAGATITCKVVPAKMLLKQTKKQGNGGSIDEETEEG